MKKYIKPKSTTIRVDLESIILDGSIGGDSTEPADAKRMTYRIFDDSDDWSDEDY